MRKLLLLLPFFIFSGPAYAQELNLDCGGQKFYMRDGDPNGVVIGLLGDKNKADILWQGDTIIVKWISYVAGDITNPESNQTDINRSTGKSTLYLVGVPIERDCKRIPSAPRKF